MTKAKQNTVSLAKQNQRGIVNLATYEISWVRKCNHFTIKLNK